MLLDAGIIFRQGKSRNFLQVLPEIRNIFGAQLCLPRHLLQLLTQYCRLKSRDAIVRSEGIVIEPAAVARSPLIAVAPAFVNHFGRAAQNNSAFSCGHQLEGLKAKCRHISPAADSSTAPAGAMSMGSILEK